MVKNNEGRLERDLLGESIVPNEAYYGIQTQRAMLNFQITGVSIGHFPDLIKALAMVKQSAAIANFKLGLIPENIAMSINVACKEIIDGLHHDQFTVDLIQGGAGTSTNMNANEVISNRAIEMLGGELASKSPVHPNDHCNMGQSSNDTFPTAMHVAIGMQARDVLLPGLDKLASALEAKSEEFKDIIKIGRTHTRCNSTDLRSGVQRLRASSAQRH